MTSAIRLRLLLAEDRPAIAGYDQDELARKLHYDRPIEGSLEAFRAAHDRRAAGSLSEADWAREGTHSEHGRDTVEQWLQIYAEHAYDHAEQIRCARASREDLGKG